MRGCWVHPVHCKGSHKTSIIHNDKENKLGKAECHLSLPKWDLILADDMFIARGPTTWQAKKLSGVVSPRLGLVLHVLIVVVSINFPGYKDHCPPLPNVHYSWGTSVNRINMEMRDMVEPYEPTNDCLIGVSLG